MPDGIGFDRYAMFCEHWRREMSEDGFAAFLLRDDVWSGDLVARLAELRRFERESRRREFLAGFSVKAGDTA